MSHSLAEYWEIKKICQKENEYLNCSLSCCKDLTAEKPNKLTKKKKKKYKITLFKELMGCQIGIYLLLENKIG